MNNDRRNLEQVFPAVSDPERVLQAGRRDVFVAESAPNTNCS